MKSLIKLSRSLIVLFCFNCILQYGLYAQNQSMLLPFSGDTYPNATGSKIINFINSSNPIVTTLPKHDFYIGIDPGNPHDEDDLEATNTGTTQEPFYLFNEKYLGQHPMYAQQVVHDKDGNLLFFIVDNNIYNRFGEAFTINPGQGVYSHYSYLHDGECMNFITNTPDAGNQLGVIYDTYSGQNYNRFSLPDSMISLDPEIAVFPLMNNNDR